MSGDNATAVNGRDNTSKDTINKDNTSKDNKGKEEMGKPETGIVAATSQGGLAPASQKSAGLVYQSSTRLPQNRPIEPSHLKVVGTYDTMGLRPVTSSGLDISSSMVVSGNRPIMKSTLAISQSYSIMGNRPVASNEIEDMSTLIGYLD
ncbi:hypothetical protein K4A83_00120 [Spirulina subsalsa FACHB-351]|uniref:Uncharacterized protein n=1 Tax=Spirulina subsalsa FACHB-351 TaxID=234711 RepID=A0ABT3KZK9_9CYAN|nr:hypothetical protein [Spirulina subsalsa]MCW6034683.1 hypothetical protein [Spirulina subsalsa FACHB-351]